MKIAIVGDWTYQNYKLLDDKILSIFNQSDYVLYNFETAIDFGGEKLKKSFNFSVKPDSNLFLNDKTVCHLANNHLCDLGIENALKTIRFINEKSKIIGVSVQSLNINPYTIIEKGSKSVGIIGCCGWIQNNELFSFLQFDSIEFWQVLKKLKDKVDNVIVSVHWGMEQVFIPSPNQRKLAKKSIEGGVDLFIGHHSHVFQPYEKYKSNYIFYSIGNFQIPITNYIDRQSLSNILIFDSDKKNINFYPIKIDNSNPKLINNSMIKEFYENFGEKYITIRNYLLYSLPMHYRQNWDSWKIRFKKYGLIEYYRYLRFLMKKDNLVGLFLFLIFTKLLNKKYNPIKLIVKDL
ncbi:MAG: CapA family protein [Candidatus Helarchaeota archaeon]